METLDGRSVASWVLPEDAEIIVEALNIHEQTKLTPAGLLAKNEELQQQVKTLHRLLERVQVPGVRADYPFRQLQFPDVGDVSQSTHSEASEAIAAADCGSLPIEVIQSAPSTEGENKIYLADFTGRRLRALGVMQRFKAYCYGKDEHQAKLKLYEHFEHVTFLTLTEQLEIPIGKTKPGDHVYLTYKGRVVRNSACRVLSVDEEWVDCLLTADGSTVHLEPTVICIVR